MNTDRHGLKNVELTERIIGVFYDVDNELGWGFLESVYEAALSISLGEAGITHVRQAPVEVRFRGKSIGFFRADILTPSVLVEIKAASDRQRIGLLLNFGPQPQVKRFLFDNSRKLGRASVVIDQRRGFDG